MQKSAWMVIAAVLASAVFYLPALVLRIIFGPDWTAFSVIPLTIGLPLLLSYFLQRFRRFAGRSTASTAYAMILGIWVLGPLWIGILMAVSRGGRGIIPALHEIFLYPIYTFIESTYAGLLGALLLTTILLLICAAWCWPFGSIGMKQEDRRSRSVN